MLSETQTSQRKWNFVHTNIAADHSTSLMEDKPIEENYVFELSQNRKEYVKPYFFLMVWIPQEKK